MVDICSDTDEAIIALIHRLRQQGYEAIDLLRALEIKGITPLHIATYVADAFGMDTAQTMSITYWGTSRSDQAINQIVETLFAEKRVGGYLRPERVAMYLGITTSTLHDVLLEPNYAIQTKPFLWHNGYTLQKDTFIPPQLLRSLEERYPDVERPPWWHWSITAQNQDVVNQRHLSH